MADKVNGRFKIFNSYHKLTALVTPPVDRPSRWDIEPIFIGEVPTLPLDKYYIYDVNGKLIHSTESPGYVQRYTNIDNVLYIYQHPYYPERAEFKERWQHIHPLESSSIPILKSH